MANPNRVSGKHASAPSRRQQMIQRTALHLLGKRAEGPTKHGKSREGQWQKGLQLHLGVSGIYEDCRTGQLNTHAGRLCSWSTVRQQEAWLLSGTSRVAKRQLLPLHLQQLEAVLPLPRRRRRTTQRGPGWPSCAPEPSCPACTGHRSSASDTQGTLLGSSALAHTAHAALGATRRLVCALRHRPHSAFPRACRSEDGSVSQAPQVQASPLAHLIQPRADGQIVAYLRASAMRVASSISLLRWSICKIMRHSETVSQSSSSAHATCNSHTPLCEVGAPCRGSRSPAGRSAV